MRCWCWCWWFWSCICKCLWCYDIGVVGIGAGVGVCVFVLYVSVLSGVFCVSDRGGGVGNGCVDVVDADVIVVVGIFGVFVIVGVVRVVDRRAGGAGGVGIVWVLVVLVALVLGWCWLLVMLSLFCCCWWCWCSWSRCCWCCQTWHFGPQILLLSRLRPLPCWCLLWSHGGRARCSTRGGAWNVSGGRRSRALWVTPLLLDWRMRASGPPLLVCLRPLLLGPHAVGNALRLHSRCLGACRSVRPAPSRYLGWIRKVASTGAGLSNFRRAG